MNKKFDPNNVIIKICMSEMGLEDCGNSEGAIAMFHKAWHEATDAYERFIAAYHLARIQENITDKLKWMETSLQCAQSIDDDNVKSAYSTLYINIPTVMRVGDSEQATRNYELAKII
ncbi:MAG: rRNA adenine methyltransferase [Chitinophagales bacterium]|nr:rRNA adenine methyltransferase [Chitinophagales bacterium]